MSEKRLETRKAPDFGAKEGDILSLKTTVAQLVQSNNNMAGFVDELRKFGITEKCQQNGWMSTVLLRVLSDSGKAISALCALLNEKEIISEQDFEAIDLFIPTDEKIKQLSVKTQEQDIGLIDKAAGSAVETGDIVIMNYRLFNEEDEVVANETQDMGYQIGMPGLPEAVSSGLVGIVPGETRMFDDVVFQKGQIKDGLEEKPLKMQVACKAIKIKKPVVQAAPVVG